MLSCILIICRWDARTKSCSRGSLLSFAVAKPVDITEMGARRRDARVMQVPEASWIYKYGAKKASDIGGARWIVQVGSREVQPLDSRTICLCQVSMRCRCHSTNICACHA
jgi:hypothetical protein